MKKLGLTTGLIMILFMSLTLSTSTFAVATDTNMSQLDDRFNAESDETDTSAKINMKSTTLMDVDGEMEYTIISPYHRTEESYSHDVADSEIRNEFQLYEQMTGIKSDSQPLLVASTGSGFLSTWNTGTSQQITLPLQASGVYDQPVTTRLILVYLDEVVSTSKASE